MKNIVLFGPPGAGKGTQSKRIIQQYDLQPIAPGDLLRDHIARDTALGKRVVKQMNTGKLVSDELVGAMVEAQIKAHQKGGGFLFDGFPRTLVQATLLDEKLATYGQHIDGVIFLSVSENLLKERIKERAKVLGRSDDQAEDKVLTRMKVYVEETLPVADYYRKQEKLHTIDGTGRKTEVFARIDAVIKNL